MSQFETTQRRADPTSSLPPTADRTEGNASAFSIDGLLALDAAAGAPPAVLALAGKTISGDGGYTYLVLPDGTFEVTAAPAGTPPEVTGRHIRPDNAWKAAWQTLCDKIVQEAGAPPAVAAPAPQPAGNLVLAGLARVGELVAPVAETAGAAVDDALAWLDELLLGASPGGTEAAPPVAHPVTEPVTPGGFVGPVQGAGGGDNLEKAIALRGDLTQGYALEPTDSGTTCKKGIIGGNAQTLSTLNCGQFTAATLAEAGYDLNTEYVDPGTGLAVAYADGVDDNGKTKVTFVTAFMLVNCQREATAAILDAQAGNVETVEGEATAAYVATYHNKKFATADGKAPPATVPPASRTAFLVSSSTVIKGITADAGQQFGAGAVAQMFGGSPVPDLTKRMPGDIQQRLDVEAGKFDGNGHSSTVFAVKGSGICYFDPANAAGPEPERVPATPGWYSGRWTIGPAALPAQVSTFSVDEVQLIDANTANDENASGEARKQAVDIGQFKAVVTDTTTQQECAGRLPTSKWRDWHDGHVAAEAVAPL